MEQIEGKYPIDVVIPYVDSRDMNWQVQYKKHSEREGRPVILNSQRFRSWDNLHYIFRGIAKFCPWVRKVHLIVCAPSQVPSWIDRTEVNVVYHRDIIPKDFRPTFNSCTIEMFIRNIPDLSEHFIYTNDDIFFIRPCSPGDFFTKGYPRLYYRKVAYSDTQNLFRHQCKASLDLVASDFKVRCVDFIWKNSHSVSPMLKSTMDKVWEKHEAELISRFSKFRKPYNVNQYVYSYYQYLSQMFYEGTFPNKYTCFKDYSLEEICDIIRNQGTSLLCINDAGKNIRFKFYKYKINQAFEEILPHPSKYELGNANESYAQTLLNPFML